MRTEKLGLSALDFGRSLGEFEIFPSFKLKLLRLQADRNIKFRPEKKSSSSQLDFFQV